MTPGRMPRRDKQRGRQHVAGVRKGLRQKAINQQLIDSIPDISYRTNLKVVF